MTCHHLEVLVEERSMAELLRLVLPKILGSLTFEIHEHRSKADLLHRLPARLAGYRAWMPPEYRILVVVDRDDDDCVALKARLEQIAAAAGLPTRTRRVAGRFTVINRIAIEELEAWYFGDWGAVRAAYPRVRETVTSQEGYRSPDAIRGGTWEAFERVLKGGGYFKTGLRKIEAARAIGQHMDPTKNTSPSFNALRSALVTLNDSA